MVGRWVVIHRRSPITYTTPIAHLKEFPSVCNGIEGGILFDSRISALLSVETYLATQRESVSERDSRHR